MNLVDCEPLTIKYVFHVVLHLDHWWQRGPWASGEYLYGKHTARVNIHGKTIDEIYIKRDQIRESLKQKFGSKYDVEVWTE